MRNPVVSIIVPVYNTEQYVGRCIQSILLQSFTDFELILIDDGSKDDSGKICEEYANSNDKIRVFHNERNRGVSFSRNVGIQNSLGKYIIFIQVSQVELAKLELTYKNVPEKISSKSVFYYLFVK